MAIHVDAERLWFAHVRALSATCRLPLPLITQGRTRLQVSASESDDADDLKRRMVRLGLADFDLQDRMPQGRTLTIEVSATGLLGLGRRRIGRTIAACRSPSETLLTGGPVRPADVATLTAYVTSLRETGEREGSTFVALCLTQGLTSDARAAVAEGRLGEALLVVEPPSGEAGWRVHAHPTLRDAAETIDPEADVVKRDRIGRVIGRATRRVGDGITLQRLADVLLRPVETVRAEASRFAATSGGLRFKRVDGVEMVYRELPYEGERPPMPMMDSLKRLLLGTPDAQRKIAMLAERRAALESRRETEYADLSVLEDREASLRATFARDVDPNTRRRVTGQVVQLRKDLARRQQMIGMLDQQLNVVGTHLHALELVRQGSAAKLPGGEQLAADAAAADEVLASLQADSEIADTLSPVGPPVLNGDFESGMTVDERAVYDELLAGVGDAGAAASASQVINTPVPPGHKVPQRPRETHPPSPSPQASSIAAEVPPPRTSRPLANG